MKSEILLIFPGKQENKPRCPFSILVLASYLKNKGIKVKIIDTRIESLKDIEFKNYSLIGISAKTGEQVYSGLKICKYIKKKCNTPIVWGGPHATFFPEQTCASKFVDFVIRSEGEETLYELIEALENKKGYEKIKGLTYKINKKIYSNEDRPFMDLNTLSLPAYDLIDIKKYQDSIGHIIIETSRGCPHRCSFCYVHLFHKFKWRVKNIIKVIEEIKEIQIKYNISKFFICDDNFFVDKKRVMEFCKSVKQEKLNLEIITGGRANYIANYTPGELKLLEEAGIKYLGIGAESGSQRILDLIKKDIKVEDIIKSAKNCIEHNITPIYSFVIGIPGEKKEDLYKTINIYKELKKISPKVEINGIYVYSPYPGTPIYEKAILAGYKPKKTLEYWAKWNFSDPTNLTWINKNRKHKLEVISKIALFLFLKDRFNSYGKDFKTKKLGGKTLNLLWDIGSLIMDYNAQFRLKYNLFMFGYEWILFGIIAEKGFKTV